jgi:hypothetical protein
MTSQGVTFCGRGRIQSGNPSRCVAEKVYVLFGRSTIIIGVAGILDTTLWTPTVEIPRMSLVLTWAGLQDFFDKEIKKMGIENTYFPLFVSEKALTKEKDHVEGFAPEVLVISQHGYQTNSACVKFWQV